MQNKANFRKAKINVNPYNTTDYENKSNWTLGENKPNQTQLSAWSRFLEPGHREEKGHHDDCCHEQAPSWGKAKSAGQVGTYHCSEAISPSIERKGNWNGWWHWS